MISVPTPPQTIAYCLYRDNRRRVRDIKEFYLERTYNLVMQLLAELNEVSTLYVGDIDGTYLREPYLQTVEEIICANTEYIRVDKLVILKTLMFSTSYDVYIVLPDLEVPSQGEWSEPCCITSQGYHSQFLTASSTLYERVLREAYSFLAYHPVIDWSCDFVRPPYKKPKPSLETLEVLAKAKANKNVSVAFRYETYFPQGQ